MQDKVPPYGVLFVCASQKERVDMSSCISHLNHYNKIINACVIMPRHTVRNDLLFNIPYLVITLRLFVYRALVFGFVK